MNSLVDSALALLQSAGFAVSKPSRDDITAYFEDSTVLGFLQVFDTPSTLVARWRSSQEAFAREYMPALLRDPAKAWNLYAIFLSATPSAPDTEAAVCAIEEDFAYARKIARAGVLTREDLISALSPLLPLPSHLQLVPEGIEERLVKRVRADDPIHLFLSNLPVADMVRTLTSSI